MKEAAIGREQSVIAHREAAAVAEPADRAHHDPGTVILPRAILTN